MPMKSRIGNIADKADRIDIAFLDAPNHEDVAALFSYWNGARGGNLMPNRADIDPVRIPKLLPHILLIDELPPEGTGRIRLFGTALVDLFGEERTGRRFKDVGNTYSKDKQNTVRQKWAVLFERLVETRAPLFAETRLVRQESAYVRLHIGAFPLAAEPEGGGEPQLSQVIAIVCPH